MIPYGRQSIDEEDIASVLKVLRSDLITQGPIPDLFEKEVSNLVNSNFAVVTNSATSSLLVSCLSLGLEKGDYLWTSPNSFVASANCALHCGAQIDFVDIDLDTGNISLEKLKEKLETAKKENKLPKIIIPVHFAGQPTDQEEIWKLSKEYDFKIIEDASHSLGAKHMGEKVGSCKWSDVTVFSFHPVKIITSCEGGMSTTNDKDIRDKMHLYRTHGITKDSSKFVNGTDPWHYEQHLLGHNFRLSDLHAALGLSQLIKLPKFVSKRNSIASRYNSELIRDNIQLPTIKKENYSSFHLYVIQMVHDDYKSERERIFKFLRKIKIGVNVHYIPIHLHPYYRKLGFKEGDFPNAEKFSNRSISLPIFYDLTDHEQEFVIENICKSYDQ